VIDDDGGHVTYACHDGKYAIDGSSGKKETINAYGERKEKERETREVDHIKSRGGYNMKPIAVVDLSEPKNNYKAATGTMLIASSNGATVVPVVSGGYKGASPIPEGFYPNCPTKPCRESPTESKLLTDTDHGGDDARMTVVIPKGVFWCIRQITRSISMMHVQLDVLESLQMTSK
jgi:hypothetical protein